MAKALLIRSAIVCTALAFPVCSHAQTLDDAGLWFAAFGNGKLSPFSDKPSRLRWWLDAHYRLRDDTDGFNQSILRPGLGYEFAENQALWVGYAWIRTSPVAGDDIDEHRLWQQWTAAPSWGDYRFLHRSRFEQRWFEDVSDDVALRWRQLFRTQRVLTSSPEWSLIGWDEAFFHLNDTDRIRSGFDQNRAFLGVGYRRKADAPIRTEIGYLNQFINLQGGVDRMNHILSVNFFL
ncbi:MAG: DUF2490 domain-containing protein [Planctomycetota bacterium]